MNSHDGAIVLVALLPVLPLALYLRGRGKRPPRGARVAAAASLALLVCGIGAAVAGG